MQRHGMRVLPVLLVFLVLIVYLIYQNSPSPQAPATSQTEFLFCHWNVKNFFDDALDGRTGPGDKEYDVLYADSPNLLRQKLNKLTDAILKMNAGKGPDILAIVEVESVRAAQLLQNALNEKLDDPALHYQHVLMKEIKGGRHIAPAILTRLPVVQDRTRTLSSNQRILVGHVKVNDHELVVVASHWTSRLQETGAKGRANYADRIYGAVNGMFKSNPAVDVLVCGDFNDDPDDDSVVNHLHATGDRASVQNADSLRMFNLLAGKDAKRFGTHFYKQWHLFDQIVVAPGLVDEKGWSCDVESLHVMNELYRAKDKQKRPWKFGNANEKSERGYSDHFPVLVRLRVEAK